MATKEKRGLLAGRVIRELRPMRPEEAVALGWDVGHRCPVVIELDDGSRLIPSSDDEGNDPGALFVELTNGTSGLACVMGGRAVLR